MGRGGTPAREISFVSLMAYGPKVSDSALAMGDLQLLKPGRAVPNTDLLLYSFSHFECIGHAVHTLPQWHLLPPLTSTVKLS